MTTIDKQPVVTGIEAYEAEQRRRRSTEWSRRRRARDRIRARAEEIRARCKELGCQPGAHRCIMERV